MIVADAQGTRVREGDSLPHGIRVLRARMPSDRRRWRAAAG
ncbi:hypothetical protein Q9R29_00140 [Rothia sp. ARF10]|nr:hypothetical protein [Rothia sp. ARF10]